VSSGLILVDTSVWIYILRQKPHPELRARVADLVLSNAAAITEPVLFELLRGAQDSHESETLKSRLRSLHPIPFLPTDWSDCAFWTAKLARRGLTVKSMDALIAFIAHQHNILLLHADRDFDRIAALGQLRVESWVHRMNRS
jgi:predicted nucleic acid-binding protein